MKVGILGSGAYGLALASLALKNKHDVIVWSHREEEKNRLIKTRKTDRLKGYKIPKELKFSSNLEEVVSCADLVIMAIPAYSFEETVIKI